MTRTQFPPFPDWQPVIKFTNLKGRTVDPKPAATIYHRPKQTYTPYRPHRQALGPQRKSCALRLKVYSRCAKARGGKPRRQTIEQAVPCYLLPDPREPQTVKRRLSVDFRPGHSLERTRHVRLASQPSAISNGVTGAAPP